MALLVIHGGYMALVYFLQPNALFLTTDTLIVQADDKKPEAFVEKFRVFDETNVVITGVGSDDLIQCWADYVEQVLVGYDIEQLNKAVPSMIGDAVKHNADLMTEPTIIYQFGYSDQEQQYIGYAYNSENGFQSERLDDPVGFYPAVELPPLTDDNQNDDISTFFVELMLKQYQQDLSKPTAEQQGIGGEIMLVVMFEQQINVATLDYFPNYEEAKAYIEQQANEALD